MKKFTNGKVTLAIGDGANDVNMIQSADVGFGLMGKEGNQAAAFADYAIPRFKDLRRSLFWHGRMYGVRMNVFIMMVIFKSMINATTKYAMQFTNGYSGIQPCDNLLIALYNVLATNWYVLFWSIYDQDVSFSKYGTEDKEKNMPYKLYDFYAYCREFMNKKRFVRMIIIVDIYSLICGFVIFFVFYFNEREGTVNDKGEKFGMYTYGVFSFVCAVILHHIQVFINTRNFTPWLAFWAIWSICMCPVVLYLADGRKNSFVRKATFPIILPSPLIIAMSVLTITALAMPMFINSRWRRVLLYPQFFTVDDPIPDEEKEEEKK